jgi:Alpha-L-arabinofuranosidase B (ABFB) domain/ADYC domain
MLNFRNHVLLSAALLVGACAEGAPTQEATGVTRASLGGSGCTSSVLCGDNNGPGNLVIYDLDGSGAQANHAGVVVLGFYAPDGRRLRPWVENDELRGIVEGDDAVLQEGGLFGAWFDLALRSPNGDTPIGRLIIKGLGSTPYVVPVGTKDTIPLYKFVFQPGYDPAKEYELCRNTVPDPYDGAITGQAIIFAGDHYDHDTLQIEEEPMGGYPHGTGWFNIACPGTGPSKMHRLRHTLASAQIAPQYATALGQRQALLRMFAADYCGAGVAHATVGGEQVNFTVDGQRLKYKFDQAWLFDGDWALPADFDGDDVEAIWGPDGARCLVTPRREYARPDIRNDIFNVCNGEPAWHMLPWCAPEEIASWRSHGYAVTVNPTVSLRSYDLPDEYVYARADLLADLTPLVRDEDKVDASFRRVPGLADDSCASFKSVKVPNHYLRHQGFRIKLSPDDGGSFAADATFCPRPGLAAPSWASFESFNLPGYFLRHVSSQLYLHAGGGDVFNREATFRLVNTPQ